MSSLSTAVTATQLHIHPRATHIIFNFRSAVRCRYKSVNFRNSHNRHPIAHPQVWLMFCSSHGNALCNIVINWIALLRHSTVSAFVELCGILLMVIHRFTSWTSAHCIDFRIGHKFDKLFIINRYISKILESQVPNMVPICGCKVCSWKWSTNWALDVLLSVIKVVFRFNFSIWLSVKNDDTFGPLNDITTCKCTRLRKLLQCIPYDKHGFF